jgi:hypothetical protein
MTQKSTYHLFQQGDKFILLSTDEEAQQFIRDQATDDRRIFGFQRFTYHGTVMVCNITIPKEK